MSINLSDKVAVLKNVGDKRQQILAELGIVTIRDLLEHFPRDYDDRTQKKQIADLIPGTICHISHIVESEPENMRFGKMTMTKLKINDGTGSLTVVWFKQPYIKKAFKLGDEYFFSGRITERNGFLQMESPEFSRISDILPSNVSSHNRIVPIYTLTSKLSQKVLRSLIFDALREIDELPDYLPDIIKKQFELCDRTYAVNNIHFPNSDESFFAARKRLVFDELFVIQAALSRLKDRIKSNTTALTVTDCDYYALLNLQPFAPTKAQSDVINEILKDLSSGLAMNRLVQGDVGSGKTFVAMVACYIVLKNGHSCALMAPTEVLAKQHYESFDKYFSKLGYETILLTGSLTAKKKKQTHEMIAVSNNVMVIGTHALITEAVKFNKLGLVITDEQHRFGVHQRLRLFDKGNPQEACHTLIMSATPIPRTLALILYGDLDVSVIGELPPGRQKIDTFLIHSDYRERLYNFIRKQVSEGRQIYIVCPSIGMNDEPNDAKSSDTGQTDLKQVIKQCEELQEIFSDLRVDALHGKQRPSIKQDIIDKFSNGETDILISTTVIEVGINVPNATMMVIENAERFGLSQLHQLRGRVGRGSAKSYCVLCSDSKGKLIQNRLKEMAKTNDGFVISELDLKLRGPGDFFGVRQHGLPEMKLANLYKDLDIVKLAQEAVSVALEMPDDGMWNKVEEMIYVL